MPTISRNLTDPDDALNPYAERGAWALSVAYLADDAVYKGSVVYTCILGHTSTSGDEPGVGASWTTYWEKYLDAGVDAIDVTTLTPAATVAVSVEHGEEYSLSPDQATQIDLSGTPANNTSIYATLWVEGGQTITWGAGITVDQNVQLDHSANEFAGLILHRRQVGGATQDWYVTQWAQTEQSSGLPTANLIHYWDFNADANDRVGSADWTLNNGAALTGTTPHGVAFDGVNDYASLVGTLMFDPNANFTVFFATPDIVTTPPASQVALFGIGNATSADYWMISQFANGNLRHTFDDLGSGSASVEISNENLPNAIALYMARRNGSAIYLECVSNGSNASGTYSQTSLTVDGSALGGRYKSDGGDDISLFSDRTLYPIVVYDAAITSATTIAQVRSWYQAKAGLSGV